MTAISTKEIPIANVVASHPQRLLNGKGITVIAVKIQRPAIVTPQAHFLMLRCLNGRNVAGILSKEITAIPATEVRGSHTFVIESTATIGDHSGKIKNIFPASQPQRSKSNTVAKMALPPANTSTTVKFITKYMARVRRLLFFTKRIIDRRFTATTATAIVRNTAYHVLHSAEEIVMEINVFFLILFSPPFRKKSNKVLLVEKGKLGGEP